MNQFLISRNFVHNLNSIHHCPLEIYHYVLDECVTEKGKIETHYGANGKHG